MAIESRDDSHYGSRLPRPLQMVLFGLRLAVGWHLLYEGIAKLLMPAWSAAPYLQTARGSLAGFFHWLASGAGLLAAVDRLNIWGLILIGLALILGFCTRLASASGIVLLALYYLVHPPLIQSDYRLSQEGHYLLVNKDVIELLVLVVFICLPPSTLWGLDRFVRRWRSARAMHSKPDHPAQDPSPISASWLTRREALQDLAAVPLVGALGMAAHRKNSWEAMHAVTGATIKLPVSRLKEVKGTLPAGTLGGLRMTRLILGGNLIGGGAHARDLLYVSSLMRAYNTDRKVIETLELAEGAGINTVLLATWQLPLLRKYRELTSGKLQSVCQVFPKDLLAFLANPVLTDNVIRDFLADIDKAAEFGADAIYVNGAFAERLVQGGRLDLLGEALERIRSKKRPAGIGGHSIEVPVRCERAGLHPDYYVKSLHHDRYWSAHPRENRLEFSVDGRRAADHAQIHDNMFDLFPEKTVEFMKSVDRPWIAFKVLAGGAIAPRDGFKFAFDNGADFICVGMFDFQIVEDVNVALDVLSGLAGRARPWQA